MELELQDKLYDWEYGRDIHLPFLLQLESGEILECREILRILPGRRLVAVADMEGQQVLIKLFLGKKAVAEAVQDAHGVKALHNAGIFTPRFLCQARVSQKGYPVLLFEFLPNALSFHEIWKRSDELEQQNLLKVLLKMVAAQHKAGLRQRDFHLHNFLVNAHGVLYAIDGGEYAISPRAVTGLKALKNLGVLFGHFSLDKLNENREVLNVYFDERNWKLSDGIFDRIRRESVRFRRRRSRKISKKAFRDCSEFIVRNVGRLRIYQRRDFPMEPFDNWILAGKLGIVESKDEMLKDGNSQTVWKTLIGDQEVVVKRYNLKNWRHASRRAITRSRASRAWENAHRLSAYHILTPQPLAMIEERFGPLRGRGWLITRVAKGRLAREYFRDVRYDGSSEKDIVRLAHVVQSFGANGVAHGDMKSSNLIMSDNGVEVIDLDSMWQPLLSWQLRHAITADHRRFLANWEQGWIKNQFRVLLKKSLV